MVCPVRDVLHKAAAIFGYNIPLPSVFCVFHYERQDVELCVNANSRDIISPVKIIISEKLILWYNIEIVFNEINYFE